MLDRRFRLNAAEFGAWFEEYDVKRADQQAATCPPEL